MKFVSEFEPGETVTTVLMIRRKLGLREYRNKFGKYFVLEAGDRTGNVIVRYWGEDEEETERLYNELKEGDVIEVRGIYKVEAQPFLSVDSQYDYIVRVEKYDPRRFIPSSENIEENMQALLTLVEEVEEPHLSKLLDLFFGDEIFVENFKEAPWSVAEVYSYMGGLAEHTLNVTLLCRSMASVYDLNRDLLLTAAILHDVGKVEAYEVDTSIRQRDEAKLLGHTVVGYSMVEARIREIVDFPKDLKAQLLHAIISHHSPIVDNVPQRIRTKEAYALFYADMMDLSLKEFQGGEEEWLYSRRLGREIFLG